MIDIEESDDERSLTATALRLRFRRVGERWTHAIEVHAEGWRTLAESVEGDPARDDPSRVVSPAYQEIHLQRDGDDGLALVVGRSGPHHFSAVFRMREHQSAPGPPEIRLTVDLADRCTAGLEALACTYRVAGPLSGDLAVAGPSEVGWDSNWGHIDLCSLGPYASPPRIDVGESRRGWIVQVSPILAPTQKTQRLQYEWTYTRLPGDVRDIPDRR